MQQQKDKLSIELSLIFARLAFASIFTFIHNDNFKNV